jgi:hypothetical protein
LAVTTTTRVVITGCRIASQRARARRIVITPHASRIDQPMCRLGMAAYWLATVSCGP